MTLLQYFVMFMHVIGERGYEMKLLLSENEIIHVINDYSDTVFKVALSHTQCKTTAEDIVQSTFLKYMECKKEFVDDEHIKAWLIRVTINECKMFHRSFWKSKRIPLEDIYSFELTEHHDIFYSVMNLPTKYRIVIHLYYYEGYSIKEIGKLINQKECTIASWLHRARKLLKDNMEVNYES